MTRESRPQGMDPASFVLTVVPSMPLLIAKQVGLASFRALDAATATPRLFAREVAKSDQMMPVAFLLAWVPLLVAALLR